MSFVMPHEGRQWFGNEERGGYDRGGGSESLLSPVGHSRQIGRRDCLSECSALLGFAGSCSVRVWEGWEIVLLPRESLYFLLLCVGEV